jgi:hypothetical protein
MLTSFSIISLFGETVPPKRGPSGFMISAFVHAWACLLLFLGLHQPRKVELSSPPRFAVRTMELHQPERKIQRYTPNRTQSAPPGQVARVQNAAPGNTQIAAPLPAPAPRIPANLIAQKQVVETLIQPDVANHVLLQKEVPIPQVMVWSSRDYAAKTIVPASQQTEAKIEVQPSLEPPNHAVHVSDLRVSPGPSETKAPLPEPSTTSPVVARVPEPTQKVPETASKSSGQPAAGSIISLSDVQMKDGIATLPMVNQVAPAAAGSLSPGVANSVSQTGAGKVDNKQSGTSAGQIASAATPNKPGSGVESGNSTAGGLAGKEGADLGSGLRSVVHLALPKDGKFSVVVVGSSAADDYPETANTWKGRLAYTVYLHIGTTKNWILQYSLPRSPETVQAGSTARPEAPWPYDITRPSIDANTGADAIIIHGYVDASGHFERLAVVFPAELAESRFLLHALQQWQFRPATQNGQITGVEVLLIIPEESD